MLAPIISRSPPVRRFLFLILTVNLLFAGVSDASTITSRAAASARAFGFGSAAVSQPCDASFASVQLLLHMDGVNAGTTFTDSSSFIKTVTASNSQTSTTQFKWGTAALHNTNTSGYVSTPDTAGLRPGSGDFTYEWWEYVASFATYQEVYSKGFTASGNLLIQRAITTGILGIFLNDTNVTFAESSAPTTGAWHFYELVRSGTAVTLYRDGSSVGTATNSANLNDNSQVDVGGSNGNAFSHQGYIDDFRITIGVARGNAVPTAAFPAGC